MDKTNRSLLHQVSPQQRNPSWQPLIIHKIKFVENLFAFVAIQFLCQLLLPPSILLHYILPHMMTKSQWYMCTYQSTIRMLSSVKTYVATCHNIREPM